MTLLDQLSVVVVVINLGSSRSVPKGQYLGFFLHPLPPFENLSSIRPSKSLDGKRYSYFTGEFLAPAGEESLGPSCAGSP